MHEKFPNLFLVGAPKSGTTTLHEWLASHPQVYMSANKEPRFFCEFDPESMHGPGISKFVKTLITDPLEYAALFSAAADEIWRGESSTDYLSCEAVPSRIFDHAGEGCRIIIMLRNPVDRAFSEFSHLVREGYQPQSFLESLQSSSHTASEGLQPLFHHVKRSLYADAIAEYYAVFGQEHVKVVLYDWLRNEPQTVFDSICDFLGVTPMKIREHEVFNKSGVPRFGLLRRLETSQNLLKSMLQRITTARFRKALKVKVNSLNLRRLQITAHERASAFPYFAEDIGRTEKLTGLDLSAWKLHRGHTATRVPTKDTAGEA